MNIKSRMRDRRRLLRKNATDSEIIVWNYLRSLRIQGYIFRRQHSIGWYIVDLYCTAHRLVIEIDGEIHSSKEQIEYDKIRDEYMRSMKITVVRYKNEQILLNFNFVAQNILKLLKQTNPRPEQGEGAPTLRRSG